MSNLAWDIFSWFLLAVAIPAIPVCGYRLLSWLQSKTQASWLKVLEENLGRIAMDVVLATFQKTRSAIEKAKSASSPGGATITPEEGRAIFDAAVKAAKDSLGEHFIKLVGKILGPTVVDTQIKNKIEAAVLAVKASGIDKRAIAGAPSEGGGPGVATLMGMNAVQKPPQPSAPAAPALPPI